MKNCYILPFSAALTTICSAAPWVLDTQEDWMNATQKVENASVANGLVIPSKEKEGATVTFQSKMKKFDTKQKAANLIFTQPKSHWNNWQRVPNVGPETQADAPILLPINNGNYWLFVKDTRKSHGKSYYAWHSTDMEKWTEKGKAAPNWATTAEYKDGQIFLYYDKPNDGDPHLVIGSNIDSDKIKWENKGMAFDDPYFGSDAGVIRLEDGNFHLISEDWSPINAKTHSWDSPLATRSVSKDGLHFEIGDCKPPVDERTKPTGKMVGYKHPNYKAKYEVHTPEQDAFGDWTNIKVGNDMYLFCDFHPVQQKIRGGIFHSSAIDQQYKQIGQFGDVHPDPTVGFAEGKFYLLQQRAKYDLVSTGPWAQGVTARAGVDTDNDGKIDKWTEWQEVKENYSQKKGFARVVETTPAQLNLDELPEGFGFQFEYKAAPTKLENIDPHSNNSAASIDSVRLEFK